ncbi:MAG: NUDIX domain-containing protein [Ruminococcaceae bacterium]|nr:NUDIX domain-containing protein [Oscillospiraceae bacterium]
MLGKFVRVKVTTPINSQDNDGLIYKLNFGEIDFVTSRERVKLKAFVLGISRPVTIFDGRIVASFVKDAETYYIVAPKSKKFIINDIAPAISFFFDGDIVCYYERSCGAIVFRKINEEYRYLIVKNRRSTHWSFPKGHIEIGETEEETAKREVFEETGISIEIIPEFSKISEYMIQNRVEKTVKIFVASTVDVNTVIQEEEIEDYAWLTFSELLNRLHFDNDKDIVTEAHNFLISKGLVK